jgi:hypothetical protein
LLDCLAEGTGNRYATRNQVHVQVRDALAYTVIDSYEAALGRHGGFHGAGEQADVGEEWADQRRRQPAEGLVMLPRDEQKMPWEERTRIQEREADLILEHDFGLDAPRRYVTEFAAHASYCIRGTSFLLGGWMFVPIRGLAGTWNVLLFLRFISGPQRARRITG